MNIGKQIFRLRPVQTWKGFAVWIVASTTAIGVLHCIYAYAFHPESLAFDRLLHHMLPFLLAACFINLPGSAGRPDFYPRVILGTTACMVAFLCAMTARFPEQLNLDRILLALILSFLGMCFVHTRKLKK